MKPDTKGFRKTLLEKLKGLKVPVEVIPTAPAKVSAAARAAALASAPAGTGAAAGEVAKLTKAEQQLENIQAALIEGQLALDSAFEEGLTIDQQKARLQEALNVSTKNAITASHELAAAYQAENAAAIKTLEPLRERAVLQRLEAEAAVSRGATGASQAAAAEAAIADEQKAHETVLRSLGAAQIRYDAAITAGLSPEQASEQLHKALSSAQSAEGTIIKQLAAAQVAGNVALEQSLVPLRERATLLIGDTKTALASIDAEAARAAALTAGAAAQERASKVLGTNIGVITKRSELTTINNELTAVATELTNAETLALEANNTALAANLAALGEEIAAMQGLIAAQRETVASTAQMSEKLALARKGFLATALAAAGARGATLAASSEFLIAAAAATGLFKSVSTAAQFETQLNVFAATAGATAQQLAEVSARAKQLGNDITLPGVSAGEAAQAMTELAKAGLSVQDSIAGSRGVLQLATAADIDNAQATELVASALNAFGLAGTNAVRVADLLTGSAIESQGSITDMGIALQQSAAAARQAGFSVQDTVALLTLLAKNGLKGSDAGTSLRTALIRLINPTTKAQKALDGLDIAIRDSQGNVRPEVFADMGVALSQLSAKQRDATLAIIFGQDAFRSAAIFAREGADGLDAMRTATEKQGLTAQLAAARTKGFQGKIESLKNSASTAGLSLGQILIPGLDLLAQALNADILLIGKFIDGLLKIGKLTDIKIPGTDKKTGTFFSGITEATGQVGIALDKLTADIPGVNAFFDPLTKQSEEAKRALEDLSGAIKAADGDLVPLASQIQAAFNAKGLSGAVEFVRDLESKITDTTPHAEELRAQLESIIRALTALGRAPTDIELKALFDTGSIPDQLVKVQGRLSSAPPLEIKAGFAKDSIVNLEHSADVSAAKSAANASNIFKSLFGSELDTGAAAAIFDPFMLQAVPSADKAGAEAGKHFSSSFQDQLDLLEAQGGGPKSALALAESQLPGALRRLQRAQAVFEKSPTKEHKAFRDFAVKRVNEIRAEIKSAKADIAGASKAAADDITKARNAADQKILDAFTAQTNAANNALLRAQGTPGLQDDIKRETQLRNLIKRQLKEAQGIKDAKTRAQEVSSLTTDLITANQKLNDLNKQLQDSLQQRFEIKVDIAKATGNVTQLRKLFAERLRQLRAALADAKKGSDIALQLKQEIAQTQQDAFDAINESFTLDIDFQSSKGSKAGEIRAREAFIKQLQKEQAQVKKGSLEWKRLRNEIADQKEAIRELKKETDDRNKAAEELAKAEFEFLQKQQGFAANLLGNLIDPGATGLVGNPSPADTATAPGAGIAAAAEGSHPSPFEHGRGRGGVGTVSGVAGGTVIGSIDDIGDSGSAGPTGKSVDQALAVSGADKAAGPTRGQGVTQISLLRQILRTLREIESGKKHPSAKSAAAQSRTVMDQEHGHG